MAETASSFLAPWASFYVMMGSSAAALTGLMFVVITLVNRTERSRRSSDGIATFSTPTVTHFCAALLVSAVLAAPWRLMLHPAVLIALTGLFGIVYMLRVMRRTKSLVSYTADVEDWTWYSVLPLVAYIAIFAGAIVLVTFPTQALFALAGGVVFLIFLGIRNAWDVVTFIAIGGADAPPG
jgi:hypothetical protein